MHATMQVCCLLLDHFRVEYNALAHSSAVKHAPLLELFDFMLMLPRLEVLQLLALFYDDFTVFCHVLLTFNGKEAVRQGVKALKIPETLYFLHSLSDLIQRPYPYSIGSIQLVHEQLSDFVQKLVFFL